jgi:hypothetical protein
MPRQSKILPADVLRNHREYMLHSVLAHGPEYRKQLREACRAYDAMILREKESRPKGRPKKLKSLIVDKSKWHELEPLEEVA